MDPIEHRLKLYTPHRMQAAMHNSRARFRVGVWGRQSGKSSWGNNELAKVAWENPGKRYWFVSPTHDQATVQYRRFVSMLWPCAHIMLKKNQTELRVKLIQQAEVRFVSGETFDNLLGQTLHGMVVDEMARQPPDLWTRILRPMLTTTGGWAAFISTPNGFDEFYDLYQRTKKNPKWEGFQAPSTCNPLFTQQEFEDAKADMSDAQFRQEIMAEFINIMSGRAYSGYGLHCQRSYSPFNNIAQVSPHLPVYLFCDFNVAPMHWLLAQEFQGHIHVFKEIYIERITDPYDAHKAMWQAIQELPLDIYRVGLNVIGDATGKATQRTSAKSDYQVLGEFLASKRLNYNMLTPEVNPHVKERVNTVNARFRSASHQTTLTIDPVECPRLHRDCERQSWKKNGNDLDPGPSNDIGHGSDALGYGVCVLAPLHISGQVGSMRVVKRG